MHSPTWPEVVRLPGFWIGCSMIFLVNAISVGLLRPMAVGHGAAGHRGDGNSSSSSGPGQRQSVRENSRRRGVTGGHCLPFTAVYRASRAELLRLAD